MKRTYYDAVVTLKEPVNGIYQYSYEGYKKIKYKMNGDNAKVLVYSRTGTFETKEFTNVSSVKVAKYRE